MRKQSIQILEAVIANRKNDPDASERGTEALEAKLERLKNPFTYFFSKFIR